MLPRSSRLRRRTDFDRTYRRGRSKASPALVLYVRKTAYPAPRIGFSVSKKVGNAVTRNRIKRRLRHVARELMPVFPGGHDFVFVIRRGAVALDHDALSRDMRRLVQGLTGVSS